MTTSCLEAWGELSGGLHRLGERWERGGESGEGWGSSREHEKGWKWNVVEASGQSGGG